MDKYELVLDIIEHPGKYKPDRIAEILSDLETREFYNLLSKTDSVVKVQKEIDIDSEWKKYSDSREPGYGHKVLWFGSRAASIAAIICTSIIAVATGIVVTMKVIQPDTDITENVDTESAPQTISTAVSPDTTDKQTADYRAVMSPIMFEDGSLDAIMKQISEIFHVEIRFITSESSSLHLYYKLDPSLPLEEIVSQLNTFDRINIKQNGNILIID
ncbi:MAG: DUF4974 domain-containing protein [Muribaculaceae bacterium]|nr:DUF4974 domain-containing protein [Muribaculaceae bacterium]